MRLARSIIRLSVFLGLALFVVDGSFGQVVIQERVEVDADSLAAVDSVPGPNNMVTDLEGVYTASVSLNSAYTSCCIDASPHVSCYSGFEGAAFIISGSRPDGSPFSISASVDALVQFEGQFTTDQDTPFGRNCRFGSNERGYNTYTYGTGTVSVGEVRGLVSISSNFGDASWDRVLAPMEGGGSQSIQARTFSAADGFNYPFCGHGLIVNAQGSISFRPGGEIASLVLEVIPDVDSLAQGEMVLLSGEGRDAEGEDVPIEGLVDLVLDQGESGLGYLRLIDGSQQGLTLTEVTPFVIATGQVAIVAEALPPLLLRGGEEHTRSMEERAYMRRSDGGSALFGSATLTVTAMLADLPEVSGTVTIIVVQEETILTVAALPDTIRVGEQTQIVLSAQDGDGGPVELEPNTPILLSLEPAEAADWGQLALVEGEQVTPLVGGLLTWAEAPLLHFAADGEQPDATTTITVSAEIEGRPETHGSGGFTLEVPPVELHLLSQNDAPLPLGDDDYLMVSKVAPDQLFEPGDIGFDAPQGGASNPYEDYDPDTFRPEALGLSDLDEDQVSFLVEVVPWDGRSVEPITPFGAVRSEEADPDGSWRFRSKRQLRLVSNTAPPDAPVQARYDDDPFGFADENRQTIRVELEDRVRMTLLVDGQPAADPEEWTVGQSAGDPGPDAVRRATLHWVVLDGNDDAVPEVITDRMSEDWAQVGVYFRTTGTPGALDPAAIRSVLSIQFNEEQRTTTGSGSVAFDIVDDETGNVLTRVTESHLPNESIVAIASRISLELFQQGFNSEVFPGREILRGETLLALDPARRIRVDGFLDSDELDLERFEIRLEEAEIPDLRNLALHARDTDDGTVDVVATDAGRLGGNRVGAAWADDPTYGNTIFLTRLAADPNDDYPMVAGHEAGHILLQGLTPDPIPDDLGHHPDPRNLMDPREGGDILEGGLLREPYEAVDGSKRLTPAQQLHARCMSGTQGDRTTLACPLGSDSTGPVLLQALGQNQ